MSAFSPWARPFKLLCGLLVSFGLVLHFLEVGHLLASWPSSEHEPCAAAAIQAPSSETTAANSATGKIFKGESFRRFTGERRFEGPLLKPTRKTGLHLQCTKWSVVTTIFEPTLAVKKAASLGKQGWCLVIVADTKTPTDYMELGGLLDNDKYPNVHFLSVEQQQELASFGGSVGAFVETLPYAHFARKNLGYLFAIQSGAHYIFDFDDDNILHQEDQEIVTDEKAEEEAWEQQKLSRTLSPLPSDDNIIYNVSVVTLGGRGVFNPYPLLGSSVDGSWPRGQPVASIQEHLATHGSIAWTEAEISLPEKVAVVQYAAQGNPDIDAIHRLTKPLPMSFPTNGHTTAVLTPSHSMVPYNAQATIHTRSSLWATLLPMTVPGRVSDIWRGYFAQAIFRDLGLSVVYAAPRVTQIRNAHNYLGDFQAELDLYLKADELIRFLLYDWESSLPTVPGRMEALWIEMYERGYIEEGDVLMAQSWLAALSEINYEFPALTAPLRHRNVVVMGQFNYASAPTFVAFWYQKWRQHFDNVIAAGPFNQEQLVELQGYQIEIIKSKNDKGFVSPLENLAQALSIYQSRAGIEGVLYTHDDAMYNLNEVTLGHFPFPTDSIIATSRVDRPSFDPYDASAPKDCKSPAIQVDRDMHLYCINGTAITGSHRMSSWIHWRRHVAPGLTRLMSDARVLDQLEPKTKHLTVPSYQQVDFLFVPTTLADSYIALSSPVTEARIFLEVGAALIVDWMVYRPSRQSSSRSLGSSTRLPSPAKLRRIDLCSAISECKEEKGESFLTCCFERKKERAMFHPLKIGMLGMQAWSELFDRAQFGA